METGNSQQKKSAGTEGASHYDALETKTLSTLLQEMNREDVTVALAVQKCLPQIEALCTVIVEKLKAGGRLFYIGAGTSGRLGILDAAEIPPTYGVEGTIVAVIAGGKVAIQQAVENAEDDTHQGWQDLLVHNITAADVLIGLTASGSTPYVLAALQEAGRQGLATGCIVCNSNSVVAAAARYPVEIITGPEYVTGSTRMKAGTAQKMALNMISTASMIQLGKVQGNKMVNMQLTNEKLRNRAVQMLMDELGIGDAEALALLKKEKEVKRAMDMYREAGR